MTFKCPYTEVCRADAMQQFAEVPELAALFSQRLQCSERNPVAASHCASRLQLVDKELPTFGRYVQEQRRAKGVTQARLAEQIGLEIQTLRDLELNKVDPTKLSRTIIDGIPAILSTPFEYLVSLAKLTSRAGSPRQGTVFARSVLVDSESRSIVDEMV